MEVKHFFFYGNLMSSFPNHEKLLKPYTLSVEKATTHGDLYYLPCGYPAMCVGEGTIKGEVMLLRDTETLITYLDFLKGYYGPGREENHYERIIQMVKVEGSRERLPAYLYTYPAYLRKELDFSAVVIPNGDWSSFMGELRRNKQCRNCVWQG